MILSDTLTEYVALWHHLQQVQLTPGVEDSGIWKWDISSSYSSKSVCKFFYNTFVKFAAAEPIWKAWAPLKVKVFMWLAVKNWLWTAARRQRRGLQEHECCGLCDQELETADHLFSRCSFSMQVWHRVSAVLNLHNAILANEVGLLDWWLSKRSGVHSG